MGPTLVSRASEVRIKRRVSVCVSSEIQEEYVLQICKKQNRKHQREEQLGSGNQVLITIQGIVPEKKRQKVQGTRDRVKE